MARGCCKYPHGRGGKRVPTLFCGIQAPGGVTRGAGRPGAGLGLTSAPGPLLARAPRPVGLAPHQPGALQVVAGAAAQHHLRAELIRGPRHQPPGDVLCQLCLDAGARDRWKRITSASPLSPPAGSGPLFLGETFLPSLSLGKPVPGRRCLYPHCHAVISRGQCMQGPWLVLGRPAARPPGGGSP